MVIIIFIVQTVSMIVPPAAPEAAKPNLERLRDRLLAREFLYDDPSAYRDGVLAVFSALREAHND